MSRLGQKSSNTVSLLLLGFIGRLRKRLIEAFTSSLDGGLSVDEEPGNLTSMPSSRGDQSAAGAAVVVVWDVEAEDVWWVGGGEADWSWWEKRHLGLYGHEPVAANCLQIFSWTKINTKYLINYFLLINCKIFTSGLFLIESRTRRAICMEIRIYIL